MTINKRGDLSLIKAAIRAAIKEAGSQTAAARGIGVSDVYLSDVLAGRRAPGPSLLRGLGFTKVVRYEPRGT